jgi:hypothetical protein
MRRRLRRIVAAYLYLGLEAPRAARLVRQAAHRHAFRRDAFWHAGTWHVTPFYCPCGALEGGGRW